MAAGKQRFVKRAVPRLRQKTEQEGRMAVRISPAHVQSPASATGRFGHGDLLPFHQHHANAMEMSAFTILLGGDLVVTPRLSNQIAGTRVIAADSGIDHAAPLDLRPELWVGDFDSASQEHTEYHSGIPRLTFPPEKDKTDGEIATDAAIERGATALVLCGAFGGARADHAFLHLTLALRLAEKGLRVLLTSGMQEGWPIPTDRKAVFEPFPRDTLFSILPFSELHDLTVEGAHWPLEHIYVPFGSSLTLSNVAEDGLAIRLGKGRALLLAQIDAK
jgi:thiamine pyrophosphokinase